jgi:TP901 family phage tail tape measure protein
MGVLQSQLKLSLVDQVSAPIRKLSAELAGFQRRTIGIGNPFKSLGGQILAFGGAYLGVTEGIRGTVGAAMDFESAFADVRKVVDASDEQFGNMRNTIRKMSTELPIASKDIAALFAAAGESGIATNELKSFAEMAARVGIAFDMPAGEAGQDLAKLKTQLGLTVAETGDLADAINHLSNNMASKAGEVTDFMLRVSALGKIGGFTAEQIAGIGSAMIAAGAPAEIAGTAMQNVVKALTKGKFAKKDQQEAAKSLGLHLPTIAKQMQKDAPKALKTVLTAISKAPKEQQLAILSQFFGDEAKAFAPLIGNIQLLDQALDSVSDKTKYSGSAFNEYVARADTTANVLQLLRNKFADLGISMGDKMLPTIKEAAKGIGDVIDTLESRVSVFDKVETAIQGFAQGLGYSGVKEVIADLGNLFAGEIDPEAGDKLGRIFIKFKEWGASIRELSAAIAENPIAKFFADLAPYGLQIMLWGAGIMMLAGTVRKLASALMFLSGASTIIGALKAVGTIADVASGGELLGGDKEEKNGKPGKPGKGGKPGGGVDVPPLPVPPSWWTKLKGLAVAAAPGLMADAMSVTPGETLEDQIKLQKQYREDLERLTGLNRQSITEGWQRNFGQRGPIGVGQQQVMDNAWSLRNAGKSESSTDTLPGKAADDLGLSSSAPIRIDGSSIAAMIQPSGVQQVAVTNQQPAPDVKVTNVFNISGAASPQAVADEAAAKVGAASKAAVEQSFGGGGGF